MKQSLISLIITFVLLIALHKPARSQYILTEADAQFELFNYTKAIDLYEQAYKKKKSLHAAERLAACYKYQSNYKQTESWYAIAMGMKDSPAENTLNYAIALQSNSKYDEARAAYLSYAALDKTVTEKQKDLWTSSCDSAIKWMKNPGSYKVKNEMKLNSSQSDWGAARYNDQITYASDRGGRYVGSQEKNRPFLKFDGAKVPDKDLYGWTGNGYLRLYITNHSDSSSLFPIAPETEYHVGPAAFSADGKEVYFTRTRIPRNPVYVRGKLASINVEIYSSRMDETSKIWSVPVAFKYNNVNEWSVGDPYLSADGNTLYFVSNMPGGKGGTDIYSCVKDTDGSWLVPVNLAKINTAGNERSPSFDGSNNFYFSSDGYPGMGGLDIFKSQISGKDFLMPQNLGYPINSPQDDFAYAVFSDNLAYLSSNRLDGMGSDDIYSVARQTLLAIKLEGQVFNKKDGLPLSSALVSLKGNNGILKIQTDDKGFYSFKLDGNVKYDLTAEKISFRSADTSFVTLVSLVKDFYLDPVELNKPIKLENIYYDFDKSNIRADAAIELDKLVKIMRDNPTIWIELGSHTDSRGNDQYNQWLSQSRANSAVQYIIDRGIEKNRISAKGYGESQLLNKCANGVKCTEQAHQLNRRTEFKIVKQ